MEYNSVEESKSMTTSMPITSTLYEKWLNHLNESTPGKSVHHIPGSETSSHKVLKQFVVSKPIFRDGQNKSYTAKGSHKGNSYIHFRLGVRELVGSIQQLFHSDQIPGTTFFEVALFVPPDPLDGVSDPFNAISTLHYQLLTRPNPPQTIVINPKHLVGHVAVLTNPPGVFCVEVETFSVAVVHHLGLSRE
ncbi:hypothetical protein VP01_3701g3 [Puccinia sorghi]|uniref:Uncharacterized protein n=1 Tax=Puccinia sorghi TaxID=27349 RepID=A0A0L6UUA2_9BASI|nr:hypothetical protein VP01_3701g3 [Puccinia sorghi]